MGTGMLITGLVTDFVPLMLAQMLWGLGWTFSSGADVAWIFDVEGEEGCAALPVIWNYPLTEQRHEKFKKMLSRRAERLGITLG